MIPSSDRSSEARKNSPEDALRSRSVTLWQIASTVFFGRDVRGDPFIMKVQLAFLLWFVAHPFLEMTMPSYDELIGAIWTLVSPSGSGDDGTVRSRPIHWSLFFSGQELPAGVMITIEANPPKAWLVVFAVGLEAREVYGSTQGPAHRWSPLETLYPAIRRAHGVVADAVRVWLESKEGRGSVAPA
jgi:hypothetical protein